MLVDSHYIIQIRNIMIFLVFIWYTNFHLGYFQLFQFHPVFPIRLGQKFGIQIIILADRQNTVFTFYRLPRGQPLYSVARHPDSAGAYVMFITGRTQKASSWLLHPCAGAWKLRHCFWEMNTCSSLCLSSQEVWRTWSITTCDIPGA